MQFRVPHYWTIVVVTLTVFSFAYLNFHGCWEFWLAPKTNSMVLTVASNGWPAPIVGLSSNPVSVPVPGFSPSALAFDALLGISAIIGAGLTCESLARSKAASAVSTIRCLLVATGLVGTWLAIIVYENGRDNISVVVIEIARQWAFFSIAIAWCTILRKVSS